MKVGIELRIDVTKIDKARIFEGQKGKYLTMTTFVDLIEKDQYDNSGMITHKKEEGEERAPILGNSKVFWSEGLNEPQQPGPSQYQPTPSHPPQQQPAHNDFEDDLPFY